MMMRKAWGQVRWKMFAIVTLAGHPPPILINRGEIERLDADGFPVGLCLGSRLVIFTDGLTDALNAAAEEFHAKYLSTLRGHGLPFVRFASYLLREAADTNP
jgi:hypothetical protein